MDWDWEKESDNGNINQFSSSFEYIKEKSRVDQQILELEEQLYTYPDHNFILENASTSGGTYDDNFNNPYEASETSMIDSKELNLWKNTFSYFRVEGKSLVPQLNLDENFISQPLKVENSSIKSNLSINQDDLVIRGKSTQTNNFSLDAGSSMDTEKNEPDEVIESNGILEEMIMIHSNNHIDDDRILVYDGTEVSPLLSPTSTIRNEVLHARFKLLWPKIVHDLRPALTKIVELLRDRDKQVNGV